MTKDDLNTLIIPALRYALGRKTYVVELISSCIRRNARNIRRDIRDKISEEIQEAIASGHAGMPMDAVEWQKVLESFKEVKCETKSQE